MSKKVIAVILSLPILFLGIWGIHLNIQKDSGIEVRIPITGYDPRDLLSGHYIQYKIDWDKFDCDFSIADNFCRDKVWNEQQRFYIPEKYAKKLDNLFREKDNKNMLFEVIYSYKKGRKPIAKELLINGENWKKFM